MGADNILRLLRGEGDGMRKNKEVCENCERSIDLEVETAYYNEEEHAWYCYECIQGVKESEANHESNKI